MIDDNKPETPGLADEYYVEVVAKAYASAKEGMAIVCRRAKGGAE